ncbi:hypothetical protein ABK040_007862 [Willaertia magna]
MHHQITLTTNFVKNFFPNAQLTNNNQKQIQQKQQETIAREEPITNRDEQQEHITTNQLSPNMTRSEQQFPQQQTFQENDATNVSSTNNSTPVETTTPSTTVPSTPSSNNNDDEVSKPTVITVEELVTNSNLTDEIKLLKFKYEQLKNQQNRLLEHLQDARVEHLQEELTKLDKLIPHHRSIQRYGCEMEKNALLECYKANTSKQFGVLQCNDILKRFSSCAQQKRKEFLGNADL